MTTTIAERVALARGLAAPPLAARELDRLAELGEGHVSMIETNRRPNIEARTATRLARVLGVSLDWLLGGSGPAPSPSEVTAAVKAARRRARAGKAA